MSRRGWLAFFRSSAVNGDVSESRENQMLLTPEQAQLFVEMLNEKGAQLPCQRCGKMEFTLATGITLVALQRVTGDLDFGGSQIPVGHIVCNNCGAMNSHALGALGLLEHPLFGLKAPQ